MRFIDKTAIVTGSRGSGLAVAYGFSREGGQVVIAARDSRWGEAAALQVKGARFIQTNVSQARQARSLVEKVLADFGHIDILVNNAGIHGGASFTDESEALWDDMYRTNVLGTVFVSQSVVPAMIRQGGGRIVHVASKAGIVREPGHAAYSASRGAAVALTRAMAIELAPQHITVNAVCPGPVMTDMLLAAVPNPAERDAPR